MAGLPREDSVDLLLDYLDYDPRPAFVLLLPEPTAQSADGHLLLKHANRALRDRPSLYAQVVDSTKQVSDLSAILTPLGAPENISHSPVRAPVLFCGTRWTITIIRRRWAVLVSHNQHEAQPSSNGIDPKVSEATDNSPNTVVSPGRATSAQFALGENSSNHSLGNPEHLAWVRQFNWESSPCGPIATWPPELRQACEMAFASPDPVCVSWGIDYTLIYNHPYTEVVGDKHPRAFGRPIRENWQDHWPQYKEVFNKIRCTGKAVKHHNTLRHLRRDGYLEETYFDLTLIPIITADRSVAGLYTYVSDTTRQVLSERRIQNLVKMSEVMATSTTLHELWRVFLDALPECENDVHFAAIYSADVERHSSSGELSEYTLEALIGTNGRHNLSLKCDALATKTDMSLAVLEAFQTGETKVLSASDSSLTENMLLEYSSCGTKLSCREVVIQPLKCDVEEHVAAVIVIAVNPFRKLDADYNVFVRLISKQIESTITTIRGLEKEKRLAQLHAASEAERKFRLFAERAPMGIYMTDCEGVVVFCNRACENLVGMSQQDLSQPMAWVDTVHSDCLEDIKSVWDAVLRSERPQTFEIQYKKPWIPSVTDTAEALDRTWGLGALYPDISEDGKLRGTVGCVTDISSVKWAEQLQSKKLSEALELKRQQESFLDITSHEMRNPLNSILHCASELTEQLSRGDDASDVDLKDCLDMATTIGYCANHQKRIVDDILTLSKLDARLLQVFPESTDPIRLVEEVLRIFYAELRSSGIEIVLKIEERYRQLGLRLVYLDPHRITQIIINLISNAIKFTKNETDRFLRLTLDVSLTELGHEFQDGFQYVPSGLQYQDPTGQAEWGSGETIYLAVSIQDTGPGINHEEAGRLFNRFSQASPRTHTQYGGSGLGLFISRELVEMHGGRMGFSSRPGEGSLFGFYVRTRRSTTTPVPSPPLVGDTPLNIDQLVLTTPPVQGSSRTKDNNAVQRNKGQRLEFSSPPLAKILIVEDNLINQRLLQKLVVKRGYETAVASNGEEALAIISTSAWNTSHAETPDAPRIDVILCDIEMPIMDGKTCVRRIRQLQQEGLLQGSIPVIAVTGNARGQQVEEAKGCGFDAVITKPYSIPELFSTVERCLKGPIDTYPR